MKQRRSGKAKAVATQAIKLYEEKDYKQALAMLEEAISHDDEFGKAWYYKGLILKEFKRYPEAIKSMTKAGELETELKAQAFSEKGHLLVRIGCYIDAVELFFLLEQQRFDIPGLQDELAALREKRGVMEGLQGRSYLQGNDFQKALISFRSSLKQNPKDKAVWRMQGEAFEKMKNYKEALKSYAKAIDAGEEEIELIYNQAMCLYHLKNYRKAKACFDKFLEANPNNVAARKMRVECTAAIERGEARDAADEELTPLVLARRNQERKRKLMGWAFVFFCLLGTFFYWFSIDWRLNMGLGSNNDITKNISLYNLAKRGNKDSAKKMIELLEKDPSYSVRSTAALAIGELNIQEAAPSLIAALKDPDWNVRCCAARALGLLKSKDAVEPLGELLKRDLYYGVRTSVIQALGNIRGAVAVNILLQAIGNEDENPLVKRAAIVQLKSISDPKLIVEPFCDLLKDKNKDVRLDAATSLGELHDKKALQPLQNALQAKNENAKVQQAIKDAIGKLK